MQNIKNTYALQPHSLIALFSFFNYIFISFCASFCQHKSTNQQRAQLKWSKSNSAAILTKRATPDLLLITKWSAVIQIKLAFEHVQCALHHLLSRARTHMHSHGMPLVLKLPKTRETAKHQTKKHRRLFPTRQTPCRSFSQIQMKNYLRQCVFLSLLSCGDTCNLINVRQKSLLLYGPILHSLWFSKKNVLCVFFCMKMCALHATRRYPLNALCLS